MHECMHRHVRADKTGQGKSGDRQTRQTQKHKHNVTTRQTQIQTTRSDSKTLYHTRHISQHNGTVLTHAHAHTLPPQLHDTPRNQAYEQAIVWALSRRPSARVVDIGAGSGLLSLVAAKAGAVHVTAYEMVRPVAAVAMVHARMNNLLDRVHVVAARSNAARSAVPEHERWVRVCLKAMH
jgi:2-polyprenyl-3-methyl-5-hydroxy-6-metoxy-1,4-benzoquinol methylase